MGWNILANGGFEKTTGGLPDSWTIVAGVTVGQGAAYVYEGGNAIQFDAISGDAEIYQDFTAPGQAGQYYRARLSLHALNLDDSYPELYLFLKCGNAPSWANFFMGYLKVGGLDKYYVLTADVILYGNMTTRLTIRLENSSYPTSQVYVDSVQVFLLDPLDMSAEGLARELRHRRRDLAGLYHARERYCQIVNEVIQQAPQSLWETEIDTTTTTVADTRRYALSLTGLTEPGQVRRVWMDDSNDNDLPFGRWQIEDDAGTLTLVLDEDPPEAGRVLTIEYLKPFSALDILEFTDETTLDRAWLLARAMSLLFLEADPALEPPDYIHQQLTYWDSLRQSRERELMAEHPKPPARARTTPWRNYV